MKKLTKINVVRRNITKFLANYLVKPKKSFSELKRIKDPLAVKRILIVRPNHRLGNMLLITPLVQEVVEIFPEAKIDLFVKGKVATVIFKNYKTIDNYIILPKKHFKKIFKYLKSWFYLLFRKYDLVINASSNSSSGKLATKFSNATYKLYGNEFNELLEFTSQQKHFAKYPIYKLRNFIYDSSELIQDKPIKELNLFLEEHELNKEKEILNSIITSTDKKTIAIFTFATGNKCYSKDWWMEFYLKLVLNFPNYNIIEILPVENVSQIDFKAPTYYSKDIRDIASFISNTEVFIGADSGMMHLACSTRTAVLGLFSVTEKEKYGPYGHLKYGINTNHINMDQCIEVLKKTLNR